MRHAFVYKIPYPNEITIPDNITIPILTQKKIFTHLLIDELPEQAFEEVFEYVANLWDFYQSAPPEISIPENRPLKGKITKRCERPSYYLTDEE